MSRHIDGVTDMTYHQAAGGRTTLPATLARRFRAGIAANRRQPLARLSDVHPGPLTGGRWIGLRTVPVECIRGTASRATSRDRDFRPLDDRTPADWQFRWSRLMSATREQAILPPVQLLRAGGDYWVVDGHNRVALAKEHGQVWIDADVTELDLSSGKVALAAKEN
jgi:hypothetical protein